MDREGSTSGRNGGKTLQTGNVVRLPRDWLGPRDELVPFGTPLDDLPSADESVTESGTPAPPSAQSFWSADAAALHAPLDAGPPVTGFSDAAPRSELEDPQFPARVHRRFGNRLPRIGLRPPGAGFAVAAVLVLLALLAFVPSLLGSSASLHRAAAELPAAPAVAERAPHPIRPPYSGDTVRRHTHRAIPRRHRHRTPANHDQVPSNEVVSSQPAAPSGGSAPAASSSSTATAPQPSSPYHAAAAQPAEATSTSSAANPPPKRAFGVGGLLGAGSSPSG